MVLRQIFSQWARHQRLAVVFAAGAALGPAPSALCDRAGRVKRTRTGDDVITGLQPRAPVDPEQFLERARAAFVAVAGAVDGGCRSLPQQELEMAVWALQERAMQPFSDPERVAVLLWRLLDRDQEAEVQLEEFVLGAALLYAAAHARDARDLGDVCWRLMDLDGDGKVDRGELTSVVRIMVGFDAVQQSDYLMAETRAQERSAMRALKSSPMKLKKSRMKVEELVNYYMAEYDLNKDGAISRAEFENNPQLQENLFTLLRKHEIQSALLPQPAE